ncbi:MAG TPA: pitrilysin family protein [Thermoanaerobaculia bacterium]|nr:pitrilysin family protein [Thermoanaerobaculia bacterium]
MKRRAPADDIAPRLPGRLERRTLGNGLRLCVLENPVAPLVSGALWYRVGARDELDGEHGAAHFLEHMMFRGAERYGAGEIDRITSALGGTCNAFTSHDATVYTFRFSRDRWPVALDIEADRLGSLKIDPHHVDRERRVILEEISMYEDEPWDALAQEVGARLYPDHPYGRPVLGTRESVLAMDPQALRAFQRRHYAPENAVLVLAGDVTVGEALDACAPLAAVPAGGVPRSRVPLPPHHPPAAPVRLKRRHGEVARLLVEWPAPPATAASHATHRLLALALAGGRSSRLHRHLVEETRLCAWVSCDLVESEGPGALSVALEALPGTDSRAIEGELERTLDRLATSPPEAPELARCRRIALADWMFGHEQGHRQAVAVGAGEALFGEGWAERAIDRLLATPSEEVRELARRWRDRSPVVGWSLPERGAEAAA